MIDFKPSNNKHGWRRVKNNKPTVFGFKSRRNFLDKFEGSRLGMRKLVGVATKDFRKYSYPNQHEAVLSFLWSHVGDYYCDVLSEFCRKTRKYKNSMITSPQSKLDPYLGKRSRKCYWRRQKYVNGTLIGANGFYVDAEGKIQILPDYIGGSRNFKIKKKKRSLEYLYEYNEKNIIIPDEGILSTKSIFKIGKGYVTDLRNNMISNNPLKVYLIEESRFDISDRNDKVKDRLYLQNFRPVFILGRKVEEQYVRYVKRSWYYRSKYFIFAIKNENKII
jgi:hypothetical protein